MPRLVTFNIQFQWTYSLYHAPNTPATAGAKIVPAPDSGGAFQDIIDAADLVASLARSIAEAAFRADITQIRIHRAEFRHRAVELMAAVKRVAPIDGGDA